MTLPELPEVETLRRQLAKRLTGGEIRSLKVLDARWCKPTPTPELERAVRGKHVLGLSRRGKYLVMELGPPHRATARAKSTAKRGRSLKASPSQFFVMHLRMTGNLQFSEARDSVDPSRHLRALFELRSPRSADIGYLAFIDPRRFGHSALIKGRDGLDPYFKERLGVEPLSADFNAERLSKLVTGRRAPIKVFLLDQRRIAGIGNIYADEALFRARIHPEQPAGVLKSAEVERLYEGIVAALEAGIEAGGASVDDFRHYDGERGRMQDQFLVHRREGQPCPRCGKQIVKTRLSGRGTYLCPGCQKHKK